MKKIFMYIFIILISNFTFAKTIDLEEALEIAEKENTDIQIEELEIRKNNLEVNKNWKAFLPELNLIYGQNDFSDSYDIFGPHSGEDDEIMIRMPLFMGFKNVNTLKKSKIELEKSHQSSSRLKNIIRQTVISKYFQVLNLQRQKEIILASSASLEERYKRLEKLYSGNREVLQSKVLTSQAEISYNEAQVVNIDTYLETALYELKFLLNQPFDVELQLVPIKLEDFDINIEDISYDTELAKAMTRGSKMENSRLEIELKEAEVAIARSEYYPKVWVEASNNYTYAQNGKEDSRVSIMVEWNIFRWGSDADTVEQRKIDLEQEKLKQSKVEQTAIVELNKKYSNIKRIKAELDAQKFLLEAAKEDFERGDVRYRNAQITFSEYINILNGLKKAEKKQYELRQDLMLAIDNYQNGWK